jgi:hypothetical protein
MKKIFGLTAVLLILVGVMVSEQVMAQSSGPKTAAPKIAITKANMATLKGTWEGTANFNQAGVQPGRLVINIENDSAPFKGTMELSGLDTTYAAKLPGNFTNATTYAGKFENATITTSGTLITTGEGGNFTEFSLASKDNLQGWFYFWGARGTANLKRKK